jgi:two-component system cell cycle sensor histidine kinase/response regulator CckA
MDHQATEHARALERELKAIREREAHYRDWLAETSERTQRLRKHTAALLDTLGKRPPKQRDLMRTLADTARISSEALGVARTGLWLFDPSGTELQCKLILAQESDDPTLNSVLPVSVSPAYFRAISSNGVVAVENVLDDPRTVGLEPYLRKHGVTALLDISIAIPGELMGVVCHEHVGGARTWHPEEIDFATHVSNMIALALEVERRQLAEAKALSAEARYRYLVESLPVTVYSFDAFSQRIEYLSPQIRELGAFDAEEWLARGVSAWIAAVHEDDRTRVEQRFAPHGVDKAPAEIQYRVRVKDGVRYLRDHCRVVRNHAGEPVAIQGIIADITEQQKSQDRAAELERQMRTLIEHVDLLAMVLDIEGKFESVNACFERSTGHTSASVIGRDAFALLALPTEADGMRDRFRADLKRGKVPQRFEHEFLTRSGERRRVVWTTTLLRSENGTTQGICSLGLDITDRARRETELLQQTKLESLGQLSAGVAHDFNNLLTVMGVQTDWIAAEHADLKTRAAIDVLIQSLGQAGELTRSLLVYARREPVSPSPVDVDRTVEELTPLLMTLAGAVELATGLHAEGVSVVIDLAQLRQLLMNLTTNAVDATRGHGKQVIISTALEFVERTVTREPGAGRAGRFLTISVTDDGRGMDERTLARVFEPFFTTKQQGQGTGLGLAMCQSIVARAGGFIRVQSQLGRGTTCRVFLPAFASTENIEAESRRSQVDARAVASALVVEDEPLVRRLLLAVLEELELKVFAAGTMAEASRIASTEQIDLLITDGTLPDGSGRMLARSARAARPQLRVLLVSGAPEDIHEFDATLHKPFTRESLLAAVKRLVNTRERA